MALLHGRGLRAALPYPRRQELLVAFLEDHAPPREARRHLGGESVGGRRTSRTVAAAFDSTSWTTSSRRLVEIDASEVATAARAEGVSEREQAGRGTRHVLADCVDRVQAGSKESYDELRKAPQVEAAPVVRQGWNRADGVIRQYAAMIWGNMETSPQLLAASPGRVLYVFDQYVQTLRVARRRLEDAWGPLPKTPEFFFVQCCSKLFDQAREISRSMPPEGEQADAYLTQLEGDFSRLKSGDLFLDVAMAPVPVASAVGMEGKITLSIKGDLPPGTAVLLCERNGLPTPAVRPRGILRVKKQRHAVDLARQSLGRWNSLTAG